MIIINSAKYNTYAHVDLYQGGNTLKEKLSISDSSPKLSLT